MELLRQTDFDNKIFWMLAAGHISLGLIFVLLGLTPILFVAFAFMLLMLTMFSLNLMSTALSAMLIIVIMEVQFLYREDPGITFVNILFAGLIFIATAVIGAGFITNRQATTKKLDEERKSASLEHHRLQSLINNMADGVIATNEAGNVVMYNGAALDIININVSLENKHLDSFLQLYDAKNNAINLYEVAKAKNTQLIERDYRLKIDDDDYINLYISISPVRIGYGADSEQGFILLLRDITREKSLEEERDEFISVVSHELRTPVTISEGTISNAQLIIEKSPYKDEKVVDTLEAAHKQIVFLADLINDLATLSRAERGVIQFDPEPINVYELVKNLERDYALDVQQKGLVLRTNVQPDIGQLISSRLYVREIIQNFITNSIKYTERGSITISAVKTSDGHISFTIKDTGIGISQADIKRLFQKFFRSEDFRTRKNNGTGLGLYVTKKLADMIKARIDVSSELNRGSTFIVTVPNLKLHKEHHDSSTKNLGDSQQSQS